jgi:internalin A
VSDLGPLQGLSGLESLICSHTPVSDLGPLQGLSGLRSLNCSYMPVSDVAPLQGLSGLESLICSHTPVSDLGPLQGLSGLESLNCSYTPVSDLAPLQGLSGLESLNCSHTPVSDLAPLATQARLTRLTVNESRVSDLPLALVFMESLETLYLFHTAVPGIPAEVLSDSDYDSCLDRLRDHLRDAQAGVEEVRETKLVVLGNGRVGKTQISRRLRGLGYDEAVPSTHGITVTSGRWAGSSDDEALNVWDFGGQDIYHGAHTLFMKTSAVFMIAWHPEFETAGEQTVDGMTFRNYPLPYWLEYVRTLGRKDCPVIVVQTRCDRPEQEVRRLPVDDRFLRSPFLKPCWYSAKTLRGRGALEEALRDAIAFLHERDGMATIGAGRMRVMRRLEEWRNEDQIHTPNDRQHRTLSQAEFRELCDRVGGVSSPESLLEYLHNVGVVFYRRDLFHDRIILDQSWALEAVYAVFDRRKAFPLILSQGGRFTRSLLAMTVWREYSEAEQRLFLSLMESCGIAFVHRAEDKRLGLETEYIAPDLLPGKEAVSAQLAGRWNDTEESWRLEYNYPFLHPGLMRALICDVGRRSHEAGVYWKYGVWVYEKATGSQALLEQHMSDERRGGITVRLQGRRREELALWLRERIEDYNLRFGYPDLAPAVDEFGDRIRAEDMGSARHRRVEGAAKITPKSEIAPAEGEPRSIATDPVFDKLPARSFPRRQPEVFVSYAWGDDTPEGRERQRVVDDLCAALGREGVKVHRDRDDMRPGDRISEFMDRLVDGDFILAVISDKYLRSEYCMSELFWIYRNCGDRPKDFLGKVIPLILPDARLATTAQRFQRAIYWETEEATLEPLIKEHLRPAGQRLIAKYRLVGEFARNTSDMLEYLVDKLMPRDFDRMAKEGFREVRELIGSSSRRPSA